MTCTHPKRIYKYAPTEDGLLVPCGKCTQCRIRKASEWAIRCEHEIEDWQHTSFVRLSYDDEHLPQDRGVHKRELQLFIKRLRKRLATPIKHLSCGEYGEQTERPHYHCLIFGYGRRWAYNGDDVLHYHPCFRWNGKVYDVLRGPLTDCWDKGQITIGSASAQSARYIAGYALKSNVGYFKYGKNEHGKLVRLHHDGRPGSFILVSRGIGRGHLDRNADQYRRTLTLRKNGKDIGLPRQYHRWLETTTEELAQLASAKNRDKEEYWRSQNKSEASMHLWIEQDNRNKAATSDKRRELNDALRNL